MAPTSDDPDDRDADRRAAEWLARMLRDGEPVSSGTMTAGADGRRQLAAVAAE